MSYKVTTRTSAPGYRESAEVIRRFRDFTWLQKRLRREYRGEGGAGGRAGRVTCCRCWPALASLACLHPMGKLEQI